MEWLQLACMILAALAAVFAMAAWISSRRQNISGDDLEKVRQDLLAEIRATRRELALSVDRSLSAVQESQGIGLRQTAEMQDLSLRQMTQQLGVRQENLQKTVAEQLSQLQQQFSNQAVQNEQKLENIRTTMESRISSMQAENDRRLGEIRETVDEKLQKTLEERLHKSFSLVSQQLEQVSRGLGEMQTLANGGGDLKKVLSNVKTRGILGEIQLGAILQEILSPSQYAENIATIPASSERVEFAIKLPGDGETPVWLPVDAKFPGDAYATLQQAYESGDTSAVQAAASVLEKRIKGFAKDIRTKYIHPPHTTDFGIMFLPTEGLYAEVVRRGFSEQIQREYKIVVAGPTTMAALLNSLQMGFRTLAIQKRSGEVWQVLSGVKAEFDTFASALTQAQNRLNQASKELENLVGVRTRQIQRRLRAVETAEPLSLEQTEE